MYALRCVHMPRVFLFEILVVTIPEECVYSNLIIELLLLLLLSCFSRVRLWVTP